MSRVKLLLAAGFAVFALSALTAATASAGEWDVNGTKLVGTAALQGTAIVLAHGALEAAGVKVECLAQTVEINSGELAAPDEIRAKDLTFHECGATAPCSLASEAILTLAIHGLASLEGTLNTIILVLPLPSKTFAAIHFEGSTCALLGVQPVTGNIHILIHEGVHPSVLHRILVFSLKGSLKEGSSEATLAGLVGDVGLASGQTWNFL